MQPNTGGALRCIFIPTLTEKSIAIQNMRGQGCDRAAKNDNGSNESVDSKNIHFASIVLLS